MNTRRMKSDRRMRWLDRWVAFVFLGLLAFGLIAIVAGALSRLLGH